MAAGRFLRTLRHLRAEQIVHRLWARARRPWFASAPYRRFFLADDGGLTVAYPPVLWPGNPDHGRCIVAGEIRLVGLAAPLDSPVDWVAADKPALWQFTLHYFEWLADLAAVGSDTAADAARNLVADWIGRHGRGPGTGSPWAWHPYPLSLRLFAWMAHGPMLLQGAPPRFEQAFVAALHRQARHLARCVEWDLGGNHVVKNLKALVVAGHCLPGHEAAGRRALQDLEAQIATQVLPDGCHYERTPHYHLQVLMDLLDIQAVRGEQTPPWLGEAIERMGTALATLRLGDGGLALFNDGDVGDPRHLSAVEARLPTARRLPAEALPVAGYFRLAAGSTVVLLDAGPCCPDDLPGHAHADMLSFEMTTGDRRLVVNCGTYAYQDATWRHRLRGTACHSTVTIDDTDSAEVYGAFRLGHRPSAVAGVRRSVPSGGQEAEGTHDGYRRLGWRHRRRLLLDNDGGRLSGEDAIEPLRSPGGEGEAAARFHLHPDVAARIQDDGVVHLTAGAESWHFVADGHAAAIEPSVYAPRFGEMQASCQIVVRVPLTAHGGALTWTLERTP